MIIKDPEAGFCICSIIILLMVVYFRQNKLICDHFQENRLHYVLFPCYKIPLLIQCGMEELHCLYLWGVIMFVKSSTFHPKKWDLGITQKIIVVWSSQLERLSWYSHHHPTIPKVVRNLFWIVLKSVWASQEGKWFLNSHT